MVRGLHLAHDLRDVAVLAVAARLPDRVSRATSAVGLAPYHAVDFDWFEGMDAFNVRLFGLALQGEDALVPELEREAAEALERVAADPGKFIGDDVKLSGAGLTTTSVSLAHGPST